jgi:hypothetical protein
MDNYARMGGSVSGLEEAVETEVEDSGGLNYQSLCSIKVFVLDLIQSGCEPYKEHKREDTWMIWLCFRSLWDKSTQGLA